MALTQVVKLVKSGQFQRVVVDTAPTGHTLRLLSFPEFLNSFLGKILRLKRRIDSLISSVKNIFGKDNSTVSIKLLFLSEGGKAKEKKKKNFRH